MLRKRVIRGAVALVLALGLFAATGLQAAEAPSPRGPAGFWTSVELWLQDLVADWLGTQPTAPASAMDSVELTSPEDPGDDMLGPESQDGGSGGTSTTDEGASPDPDG